MLVSGKKVKWVIINSGRLWGFGLFLFVYSVREWRQEE